jgi:hypothetical protein
MPYKFNQSRRHKIPKAKYRVTNWPEYDAALVRRGNLTVWVAEEAVAAWHAPATGRRGGQPVYSDLAIETGLALRLVLHQPLRQTEGALRSIADLLGAEIRIPDHTTFSRRSGGLTILPKRIERNEPLHLLVDSTGVKIYGEGEWLDQKHGFRSRRRWRKLHLAVDADTHEIAAVELTPDDIGDVSAVADLLDQIEDPVASMTGDGAYDGQRFTMRWRNVSLGPLSSSLLDRRPFRARLRRRSATCISRRLQGMAASAGSGVRDIPGGAESKRQCTDTKPSSAGVFTPGLCPIKRPRRRSDAMSSTA